MNHIRIRGLSLTIMAAVLACGLMFLTDTGPASANDPWPTPPPGPRPPVPNVIEVSNIKPVEVPRGATSWVIPPVAMFAPRFPPVPSNLFRSNDGVSILSDAGSITTTVQIVYQPVENWEGLPNSPLQEVRKVFDLRAFDHQAKQISLDLRRPWVLDVGLQGIAEDFDDPARFLIARYEEGIGWVPLVTSYRRNQGILQARVLQVGRFAVLAEPSVISG